MLLYIKPWSRSRQVFPEQTGAPPYLPMPAVAGLGKWAVGDCGGGHWLEAVQKKNNIQLFLVGKDSKRERLYVPKRNVPLCPQQHPGSEVGHAHVRTPVQRI